ncbi:hypothetical protein J3R82DRAFT_11165 [Butyriboletus roseoflavus]|nr:hypothetical protein J3R82DRAFT_11165 [Butyriboletus roseoflavus]
MVTSSTGAVLQDPTVVEANQFPIKSVKLFSSGTAEITRTFPLSFLRSQDEPQVVEIVHFPEGLQSVDISVTSTSGKVTILDHYHTSVAKRHFEYSTLSSQTLRELETEQLRLEHERRLRQQSFTFLTTYMDSLAQCKSHEQPEAAQMVSFFDDFVEIGITRSVVIVELDAKLADVGNKITEEKQRLSKLSGDLPVKVVTVLSCNNEVPVEAAELTMTYVVKQVSWKPAYDLHVTMSGNMPSPMVRLDFRCTVTQWTGENWENVSLALTTADQVSQLIQLPEPKKIDIRVALPQTFPRANQPTSCMFGSSSQPSQGTSFFGTASFGAQNREQQGMPSPTPVVDEAPKVVSQPQTVSQLISHGSKDPITHVADGGIFVPSDHAEHQVLVASLSLQAEFMRVVVPSTDTRMYYTCEVKNTSEYVLLPGIVKTYLNDKHVSSAIHNTELPQVLECSLAVDTGVKTIHNRAPDALPSVNAFTGKATTTYTSATVVQNTHAEPIRGVIVRSSIPLPADPRISIVLKEPLGLAEIDEGSVTIKEGCLARWSTMGGRKGKQEGLFEWVCDVNPGTEVLKAVWEVCGPQDMKLSEQAHS